MHQFLKSHFTEVYLTLLVAEVWQGQGVLGSLVEGEGERETSINHSSQKITTSKTINESLNLLIYLW